MKQEIEVAVEWWGNKLQERHTHHPGELEVDILATLVFPSKLASSSDAKRFKEVLCQLLLKELAEHGDCTLMTDYDPQDLLHDACKAANISSNFPIKTVMRIKAGHVAVRVGYAAKEQDIYRAEGHQ